MENKKDYRQRIRDKKEVERASSLLEEVNNIYKNCNLNSRSCRVRYKQATLNFVRFLIENHSVKSLKNIQEVHILNYIDYKKNGPKAISDATLNLNVTAILFTLKRVGYLAHLHPLKEPKHYLLGGKNEQK